MAVNAQDGSGTCKLPGTYDYVNVDYYKDGHLAVSNQSGMKITQLHITVTVTHTWTSDGEKHEIVKTVCDKNFYDIPANQTTRLTDGVQTYDDKGYGKHTYKVKVGNPICKAAEGQ